MAMKMKDCEVYETNGSFWFVNTVRNYYLRTPKGEIPRELPEWGDENAGTLQDFTWHPFSTYSLGSTSICMEDCPFCPHLLICDHNDIHVAIAPNARLVS